MKHFVCQLRHEHECHFKDAAAKLASGIYERGTMEFLFPVPAGMGGKAWELPSVDVTITILHDPELGANMHAIGQRLLAMKDAASAIDVAGMHRIHIWATLFSEICGDRPNTFCEVLERLFGDREDERVRVVLSRL